MKTTPLPYTSQIPNMMNKTQKITSGVIFATAKKKSPSGRKLKQL